MTAAWHIASFALFCRPERLDALRQQLDQYPELSLEAASAQGKLVVLLESQNDNAIPQCLAWFEQQPGVIQAALVYHQIIEADPRELIA